jgi:hypothetical protein
MADFNESDNRRLSGASGRIERIGRRFPAIQRQARAAQRSPAPRGNSPESMDSTALLPLMKRTLMPIEAATEVESFAEAWAWDRAASRAPPVFPE